jgi:hypothetical protein
MPHLQNCDHKDDGWCGECVREMGEQIIDLREAIFSVSIITLEETHNDGESEPSRIEVKQSDFERLRHAQRLVLDACKKYLI